jgi:beta-glucosidase
MSEKKFPVDFFWGAATASYQVEGGIENCDWAQAAREGKVPTCGTACDHYNLYESDFDIVQQLGHNCHRLSIEWARIEPREGEFDEKEIEHYRAVVRALRARNIEPFITLWHFTLPQWFSEKGGFERNDAPEIFARYCAYVVEKLDGLCTHYATINEPNVFASAGWLKGTWPPFKRASFMSLIKIPNAAPARGSTPDSSLSALLRYIKVVRNLIRAHNTAYDAVKRAKPDVDLGIVKHVVLFHANGNPLNKLLAVLMNWIWTHYFMKRVYKKCDSIGLNYYQHKKFGDTREYVKTDMGWDVYPEGICGALLMLKRYGKSLYVAEAGIADAADTMRADYLRTLIACTHAAITQGLAVHGFMYWSLLDNYEWALGFDKHFGLVAVNFETQERNIRPSAYVYKEIIEHNGLVE